MAGALQKTARTPYFLSSVSWVRFLTRISSAGPGIAVLKHPAARARLCFCCFLVLLGAFYLTHLREGHAWGDDFALYILQAKNIATGHPLANTGYIFNPQRPVIGPAAYPPAFPLLLSPVYRIWGLNLSMMKAEIVIIFLVGLFFTFELFSAYLPPSNSAVLVAILGSSPYFYIGQGKAWRRSSIPLHCHVVVACPRNVSGEDGKPSAWIVGLHLSI
jgi:hypothetical protein